MMHAQDVCARARVLSRTQQTCGPIKSLLTLAFRLPTVIALWSLWLEAGWEKLNGRHKAYTNFHCDKARP